MSLDITTKYVQTLKKEFNELYLMLSYINNTADLDIVNEINSMCDVILHQNYGYFFDKYYKHTHSVLLNVFYKISDSEHSLMSNPEVMYLST